MRRSDLTPLSFNLLQRSWGETSREEGEARKKVSSPGTTFTHPKASFRVEARVRCKAAISLPMYTKEPGR